MPNTPDDPNAPKPDDKGQTASNKPDAPKPADPDSSIDMTIPAEGVESSGISVHEWAALVEETPPGESGSQVKIDSPSDADLLGSPPTDAAIDLSAEPVVELPQTTTPPDSQVRLGDASVEAETEALADSQVRLGDASVEAETEALADLLADSGVSLSASPPVVVPDESAIDYSGASIIDEAAAASTSDSSIDLTSNPAIPVPQTTSGSSVDLASDAPVDVFPAEESAIDLAGAAVVEESPASSVSSAIDLPPDVVIEESVDFSAGGKSPGESAIDLPDDVVVEEDVMDLTQEDVLAMGGPGESGIDLAEVVPGTQGGSSVRQLPPGESGIDLIAEDVILEEPATPSSAGGSSRDLIAEGLESGVDLMGTQKAKVGGDKESEDALVEALANAGPEDYSSSVDLGSAHVMDVFQDDPSQSGPAGSSAKAARGDSDAIDLGEVVAEDVAEPVSKEIDLDQIAAPEPSSETIASGSAAEQVVLEEASKEVDPNAIDLESISDGAGEVVAEESGTDLKALAVPSLDKDKPTRAPEESDEVNEAAVIDSGVVPVPAKEDVDVKELVNPNVEAPAEKGKKKKKKKDDDSGDEVAAVEKGKKKKEDESGEVVTAGGGRKGGRFGAFVLGGFLMAMAAALGYVVVWVMGLEPPGDWRDAARDTVGMQKLANADNKTIGGDKDKGGGKAQPDGVDKTLEHVRNGDLDRVNEAAFAQVNDNDASQLVGRADYYWTKYLRDQRGQKLDAKAEPVQKALADLGKAIDKGSADALLMRGQVYQMTGNAAEARKDFAAGQEKFKADAGQKERFDAAIAALDVSEKIAMLMPPEIPPHLVTLILVLLQAQEPPPGGNQPKLPGEAGVPFLQALKAVKDRNYSAALPLLEEARKRHDERRFLLPRKQQNPTSDAREAIFLLACDQLRAYWSLLNGLKDPTKYLAADDKNRLPAVDNVVKAGQTALVKDAGEKMFKDKVKDKPAEKLEDLVALLGEDRKERDDKIATRDTTIADQKKMIDTVDKDLKTAKADLKDRDEKLTASLKRETDLNVSLKAANALLGEVAGVVGTKFNTVKGDGEMLVKDLKEAAELAKDKDPEGTIKKLKTSLAIDEAKLKERWEPAQMLPYWLAVLQGDRSRTDLHPAALKDAQRVLADKTSTEADRGRARAIEGLVQRNEDKFDASAATLKGAKEALTEAKAKEWIKAVDDALKEVSNPAATIARRADNLASRNRTSEALAVLKKGLEVVPDKKGELYAQRARIGLEGLVSRGKPEKDDPEVAAVRKDAQAAAGEGLAEGSFVLGRLEEELGNLKEAIANYRAAVKTHGKLDEQGSRYSAALARALAKSTTRGSGPRPLPPRDRTSKAAPQAKDGREFISAEVNSFVAALTAQAPDLPAEDVSEAERLADEIIKLGKKAPFDALAQALVVKRLYTRALVAYLTGLGEKGLLAPEHSNALLELVRIHPGMKPPGSLDSPAADPLAAEKAYASGLNFYAKKKYAEAEREFLAAVELDNGDARYYYFLGLSRLAQGNRDGYEDFDVAARLERLGRPDSAAVSKALERVQGPWRKKLNDVRERPVKDRLK